MRSTKHALGEIGILYIIYQIRTDLVGDLVGIILAFVVIRNGHCLQSNSIPTHDAGSGLLRHTNALVIDGGILLINDVGAGAQRLVHELYQGGACCGTVVFGLVVD